MPIRVNTPEYGSIFFNGDTVADLRAVPLRKIRAGYSAILSNRVVIGDNLGALFVWSATSTTPPDEISVLDPEDSNGSPGRWIRIAADQIGATGTTGLPGDPGPAGAQNAVIFIYQRADTAPARPTAETTYTYATGVLSGLTQGWSTSIPSGSQPLWVSAATSNSTDYSDAIEANEWSAPVVLARNGVDGFQNALVYIFQRGATAPTLPSATTTFTFATSTLTGLTQGWSSVIPAGTDPLYVSVASAEAATTTDTIAANEWSTPVILAQNGTDGLHNAQVLIYQRSATQPSTPTSTATYTFASAALTGLNNGWSATLPAGPNQLWVSAATASAVTPTDTIMGNEWSTPVVLSQDGTAGLNTASLFIYQRAASAPALPSATTTYTFSTSILSGLTQGWTTTIPSGTLPLYISTATADSTTNTDMILASEWASPSVLAQNGAAGASGSAGANGLNAATVFIYVRSASMPPLPTSTTTYTFATGALTGLNNSWSEDVPAGTLPLYVTTATASSTGTTDTISANEWAAPQVLAQNGAQGSTGANGLNSASVFIYQRSPSVPALPTSTTTYTFATSALTGLNNGWQTTIPTGSDPVYVSTATAVSTGPSDTIDPSEWAAAHILAANGAPGANGAQGAPGADATPIISEGQPSGSYVVGQTWYQPSTKTWRYWTGSTWAQLLGSIATYDAVGAGQIAVTSLSAISATIGRLRTATSGARTEITDNQITVYDSNGTLRVRLGVF